MGVHRCESGCWYFGPCAVPAANHGARAQDFARARGLFAALSRFSNAPSLAPHTQSARRSSTLTAIFQVPRVSPGGSGSTDAGWAGGLGGVLPRAMGAVCGFVRALGSRCLVGGKIIYHKSYCVRAIDAPW